jgi:D-alanyl-lipoteichoic acid acyltransferase DltB (MBOAT superfamily)
MFGIVVAVLINLIVVGAWHGANWTYVLFGLYHGLLFIPLIISGEFQKKQKVKFKGYIPNFSFVLKMMGTYLLVAFGLIIFKASSMGNAWAYLTAMCTADRLWSIPQCNSYGFCFGCLVMLLEWRAFVKKKEYAVQTQGYKSWITDLALMIAIIGFSCRENAEFIYFQF